MSRRVVNAPVEETLDSMIVKYSSEKAVADQVKKVVDEYNGKIKEAMQNMNISEYVADGLKASISITPKEDFNELQAIEILRSNLTATEFSAIVKTKEYLDFDALENATYTNKINPTLLKPCVTPKAPVITLRVVKSKK